MINVLVKLSDYTIREYYKKLFGERTELVFVYYDKEKKDLIYRINYFINSTTDTSSIRQSLGQAVLTKYGMSLRKDPMNLILVPMFSLVKGLGLKNYIKFIKDWRGQSKVGEDIVVNYIVVGDR